MKRMPSKTVAITDLELFVYLISRGVKPHTALESMIRNHQKLKETREYLNAMINHIDESKKNND